VNGRHFRVLPGTKVRLRNYDTHATDGFKSKKDAEKELEKGIEKMRELQEKLYAADSHSLLLIFQALDAAGKDSTIAHVMSGLNPQGCQVFSFKAPSEEELDHNFLWRAYRCLPERGRIGVFNRSYYEEVLVVRVHPELLEKQRLPPGCVTKRIWEERYEDINSFEKHLSRNGTVIRKFFLNVSKDEQKQRFLDRLKEPEKHWKFSARDLDERRFWDDYTSAYERMLGATSTSWAPWYVIPADNKWFMRLAVAAVIDETLKSLKLEFPEPTPEQVRDLKRARRTLERGGNSKGRT
jgi:PPK2 family polyphosphate:nucleotide phosphotransferase